MNQTNTTNMPDLTLPGITTSALSIDNLQNGSDKTATGIKQQIKHKILLSNKLHPQQNSRKITWHSPDGNMHTKIDYILTPQRFK